MVDALAIPRLIPKARVTFNSPPASPLRSWGAAAMIAVLLAAVKRP